MLNLDTHILIHLVHRVPLLTRDTRILASKVVPLAR